MTSSLDTAPEAPRLLTRAIVCRRLGISRWTWAKWVKAGIAPAPVSELPGWPRWKASEIDRFSTGTFRGPGKRTYFSRARQAGW